MADASGFDFFLYDNSRTETPARTAFSGQVTFCELAFPGSSGIASFQGLTIHSFAQVVGTFTNHYFFDFYFRVWIIPSSVNLTNPGYNVAIPIGIWNAFPQTSSNELLTIGYSGPPGVSLNVQPNTIFLSLQYNVYDLIFTQAAPLVVDASFGFQFTTGSGHLQVHATLATTVSAPPEQPVTETWEFLSGVLTSVNGTEQRTAIRSAPRRTLQYDTIILNPDEYQLQVQAIWSGLAGLIVIPWYQYTTSVISPSAAGTNTIYVDITKTDLQVGDFVLISTRSAQQSLKATSIIGDVVTLSGALSQDIKPGDNITPAFSCYLPNKTMTQMKGYQVGRIAITASTPNPPHASLSRPGSNTVFANIDGIPVIDKVPLGNSDDDFGVETGAEMIDFMTGLGVQFTTYTSSKFLGSRQWKINRYFSPQDMDYWRDLCQYMNGQLKPVLLPTFRPDFQIDQTVSFSGNTLTLIGSTYGSLFFNVSPAMRYVALKLSTGWHYSRVESLGVNSVTGGEILNLAQPIQGTTERPSIVSLVIRCRSASDTVTLTHSSLSTVIDLSFMSTEQ